MTDLLYCRRHLTEKRPITSPRPSELHEKRHQAQCLYTRYRDAEAKEACLEASLSVVEKVTDNGIIRFVVIQVKKG
jgi:predicted enzyme involved in methoxymalonyl-ACP biosynthesis